jgi:hypothetical protein
MSRYFFDVKNGHRFVDPAGLDCSDDEEAISNVQTIRKSMQGALVGTSHECKHSESPISWRS